MGNGEGLIQMSIGWEREENGNIAEVLPWIGRQGGNAPVQHISWEYEAIRDDLDNLRCV